MSRVAKQPVPLPQGVTATIGADSISVKGAKGTLSLALNSRLVKVVQDASALKVEKANDGREADMVAGSTRAHLACDASSGRCSRRESSVLRVLPVPARPRDRGCPGRRSVHAVGR